MNFRVVQKVLILHTIHKWKGACTTETGFSTMVLMEKNGIFPVALICTCRILYYIIDAEKSPLEPTL
jgi:hypothetical protein